MDENERCKPHWQPLRTGAGCESYVSGLCPWSRGARRYLLRISVATAVSVTVAFCKTACKRLLTLAEAIETTRIHRVAGLTGDRTALVTTHRCRPPTTRSRMRG